MKTQSLRHRLLASALGVALIGAMAAPPAFAASMEQKEYTHSMQQQMEMIRDRVAAQKGDDDLEQAWEEAAGDWGRLQLATEQQWEEAKAEFEESWEALETILDEIAE